MIQADGKIKPKVLIMSLTDQSWDPRPRRYTQLYLERGYQVDVMGYPFAKPHGMELGTCYFYPKPQYDLFSKIRRRIQLYSAVVARFSPVPSLQESLIFWRHDLGNLLKEIKKESYDVIMVEDIYLLPFAFAAGGSAKVIFDAREYYPSQFEEFRFFRWFDKPMMNRICSRYLKRCAGLITTSVGFQKRYKEVFDADFDLIRSTPNFTDYHPGELKKNQIRMVHHGVANRNRQLEKMIRLVKKLDKRFTLDFYLKGEVPYINELKAQAADCNRIRFQDPVAIDQIIPTVNQYDIGLYYVEPSGFNVTYWLPNKIFEFIQGRLMLAIGPSPDMAAIVREYECGEVAEEFSLEAMEKMLSGLTEEKIKKYKQKSHEAASLLCFENEKKKMHAILDRLGAK